MGFRGGKFPRKSSLRRSLTSGSLLWGASSGLVPSPSCRRPRLLLGAVSRGPAAPKILTRPRLINRQGGSHGCSISIKAPGELPLIFLVIYSGCCGVILQ